MPEARLARVFFASGAVPLAVALLGKRLVRVLGDGTRLAGIIVEVEAYLGVKDRASHAFGGRRTARNESMYAAPGTAYVYFTYGMHWCFNVVCAVEGVPEAVLIRAIEPIEGIEAMRAARVGARDLDLCRGPARLCKALAIDRSLDREDLTSSPRLWIEDAAAAPRVMRTARIGVGYSGAWAKRRLRFLVRGSAFVSGRSGTNSRLSRGARGR